MTDEELKKLLEDACTGDWLAWMKVKRHLVYGVDSTAEKHRKSTFKFLREKVKLGNHYAEAWLGSLHANEHSGEYDKKKAKKYYQDSANAGNPAGHVGLGWYLLDDAKTRQAGIEEFQKAAKMQYVPAYYALGSAVAKSDPGIAQQWYQLGAQSHDPNALHVLCVSESFRYLLSDRFGNKDLNPFFTYIPANLEIYFDVQANMQPAFNGVNFARSYTVTARYTGALNIGERVLYQKEIQNRLNLHPTFEDKKSFEAARASMLNDFVGIVQMADQVLVQRMSDARQSMAMAPRPSVATLTPSPKPQQQVPASATRKLEKKYSFTTGVTHFFEAQKQLSLCKADDVAALTKVQGLFDRAARHLTQADSAKLPDRIATTRAHLATIQQKRGEIEARLLGSPGKR